jgi:hypothetical protein
LDSISLSVYIGLSCISSLFAISSTVSFFIKTLDCLFSNGFLFFFKRRKNQYIIEENMDNNSIPADNLVFNSNFSHIRGTPKNQINIIKSEIIKDIYIFIISCNNTSLEGSIKKTVLSKENQAVKE